MNVHDTKQIYYSILYKTYIDYDIARRNCIWRLFEIIIKWRRLMFVLFLLDSSRHLCSFGKWKKCKKYMRHLSGTFSAFVVWLSRFFWALIYQRKWKETLSRCQKRQELHNYYLPSMIDDFEKKCCVYKARTHSLTTFGPQGFDKIVYFILFFNLKQFSLGGVIYPAEFVF